MACLLARPSPFLAPPLAGGLLFGPSLLSAALRAAPPCAPRLSRSAKGWLLQVALPGATSADVSVELRRAARTLAVHAEPRFSAEYALDGEAGAASASLVDGVLRVAVTRAPQPEAPAVPVAAGELPASASDHDPDHVWHTVELALPGVAADQIRLTLPHAQPGRRRRLAVAAPRLGQTSCYLPADADLSEPSRVRAAAQHGLLKVAVPKAAPEQVPVAAQLPAEGLPPVLLAEVPGVGADQLAAEVSPTGVLRVRHAASGADVARARVTPGAALLAGCADGLLRVTLAAQPEEEAAEAVTVSATEPASLPEDEDGRHAATDDAAADEDYQMVQDEQPAQ